MHSKLLPRQTSSPIGDVRTGGSSRGSVEGVVADIRGSVQSALVQSYDSLVQVSNNLFLHQKQGTQAALDQMHKLQQWTAKLEAARRRKEELARVHLYQQGERNQRQEEVARRIQQQRLEEQLQREETAFEELKKSQDYVHVSQVSH